MCEVDRVFFDAHSKYDPADDGALLVESCGSLTYGHAANEAKATASMLRAATLNCIVGPNDSRFPAAADVLDLHIDDAALVKQLREPRAHWWPLCGSQRRDGKPVIVHVNADDFGSLAKGLTRLARAFPAVRFIADPFLKGKTANWQAGVCLADVPNVWITTRGLYASEITWPDRSEREALHFTIGEVGAGKLLFASGLSPAQVNARHEKPADWLASIAFLEPAQRELILRKNAADAFAASDDQSTLHAQ
jgi:hypothetical protein